MWKNDQYTLAERSDVTLFNSDSAREAGYLDEVVQNSGTAMERALTQARRLQALGDPGYLETKRRMRQEFAAQIGAT